MYKKTKYGDKSVGLSVSLKIQYVTIQENVSFSFEGLSEKSKHNEKFGLDLPKSLI